jgi:hypothetical protein
MWQLDNRSTRHTTKIAIQDSAQGDRMMIIQRCMHTICRYVGCGADMVMAILLSVLPVILAIVSYFERPTVRHTHCQCPHRIAKTVMYIPLLSDRLLC